MAYEQQANELGKNATVNGLSPHRVLPWYPGYVPGHRFAAPISDSFPNRSIPQRIQILEKGPEISGWRGQGGEKDLTETY
ncbi:ubiquitin carboxyl-terminal hydrolase-like isoform X1 [Anopheles sinensis]|uniref:Ubiquitin carboxyl-terminal hydrolase-like isoform X1 n=1 Tax=Anopheles sinensis TaxID=74873 RepID=A0A084W4W8_ANOSI|nr:ubiquitin carboxyl-terminal hydrolase-like isoform X1 [Anopheles sinensis]